jgi:Ran GTPase-activating protein (RanGAP) involved in mRNA processing and transport
VTGINIYGNQIGAEGASALADALKMNSSVTNINLDDNAIGDEGASVLADALKVNTSVTDISLRSNKFGAKGATAIADALKVNTSLTRIDLSGAGIDESNRASLNALVALNERLRHLFLFDARRMLLSLMCADECGVVWPYLLDADDRDVGESSDNVETLRAEFAAVVEERRRRAVAAPHVVAADPDEDRGSSAVKRRRINR